MVSGGSIGFGPKLILPSRPRMSGVAPDEPEGEVVLGLPHHWLGVGAGGQGIGDGDGVTGGMARRTSAGRASTECEE